MVNYQKIFLIIGSLVSFVPPTQANMWNWSWSWLWGNQNKSTKEVIAKKQPVSRESFLTATAIHNASKQHTAYFPRSGPRTIADITLSHIYDYREKNTSHHHLYKPIPFKKISKTTRTKSNFPKEKLVKNQKTIQETYTLLQKWKAMYQQPATQANGGHKVLHKLDKATKSLLKEEICTVARLRQTKLSQKQFTSRLRSIVSPFNPDISWKKKDEDLQKYCLSLAEEYAGQPTGQKSFPRLDKAKQHLAKKLFKDGITPAISHNCPQKIQWPSKHEISTTRTHEIKTKPTIHTPNPYIRKEKAH